MAENTVDLSWPAQANNSVRVLRRTVAKLTFPCDYWGADVCNCRRVSLTRNKSHLVWRWVSVPMLVVMSVVVSLVAGGRGGGWWWCWVVVAAAVWWIRCERHGGATGRDEPEARSGHVAVADADGNFMYVYGGFSRVRGVERQFAELWRFHPLTQAWEHISTTGEASGVLAPFQPNFP
jgi:hypothetical protein